MKPKKSSEMQQKAILLACKVWIFAIKIKINVARDLLMFFRYKRQFFRKRVLVVIWCLLCSL
jgi:hypothetical protein